MTDSAYRKKLIEVDLPLDEINYWAAREKSIRHGHPSTLHLWWAPRPLSACRAVIFASMVDDPSSHPEDFDHDEEAIGKERERLHGLIRELVRWESTDEGKPDVRKLIAEARCEIARSVARSRGETAPTEPAAVLAYLNDKALPIYDPFAGGGSIPLEAQRLGLRAVGSDLNPVAVLINKALIELPPKFNNRSPVNPAADPMGMFTGKHIGRGKNRKPEQVAWRGAAGLADDIRYYGRWMREEAFKRIGHLYPKAKLPDGGETTVIAWLWARTVPCPNPACGVAMPMMKTFELTTKDNNRHWTKPVLDREGKSVSFVVQDHSRGVPTAATVNRSSVICVACQTVAPLSYAREQSRDGNIGEQMTAIVAEGDRKRVFLSPTNGHVETALSASPNLRSIPQQRMPTTAYLVSGRGYGITHWHQLFTERQLTVMDTFCELVPEARRAIIQSGAGLEYANTICTYLALSIGRTANGGSSFATWDKNGKQNSVRNVFARQAIPMVWDFAESNPFSNSTQNWMAQIEWIAKVIERLPSGVNEGEAYQADASTTIHAESGPVIVTDPPYYDNISYAELSDFFYVWLRQVLRDIYPDLFAGILVPIQEEMIAAPRFENPKERFEELMNSTLMLIRERCSPEFPSSIFYAYKQQEEQRNGKTSTGWETMLTGLVNADFQIVGTWPMRTELANRPNSRNTNALASSVVLVCRPRPEDAPTATRRQFLDALQSEMPAALDHLTREGHIAPTDLAQAAIGPGMEIYSRYSAVNTVSGEPVSVRDALVAINQAIENYFEAQEGEIDRESRFCLDWLKGHEYTEGDYGEAELLSQAKNVAIESDAMRGLVTSGGGIVKLRRMDEYGPDRPLSTGMSAWEGCMRMAYHLNREYGQGVEGAGDVARQMAGLGAEVDSVERLARILYNHYDRKNDSANAVIFNNLVTSWQGILTEMRKERSERLL